MNANSQPISPQEALIYAMVSVSAADRKMTDRELRKIGDVVKTLPAFADFNLDNLVKVAEACSIVLQRDDGLDAVLGLIAALPPRLHDTAYAVAVEVAAADLYVEQEELRFLRLLRDRLNLDPLVSAAIERAARARYRSLGQ